MEKTLNFRFFRLAFLALLATVVSAGLLSAEDFVGKFTLPFEARWGRATLPAGDYQFTLNTAVSPYTAHIEREGRAVALVPTSGGVSDSSPSDRSQLIVVRHGKMGTIRALQLAEAGRVFSYIAPKGERQLLAQGPVLIQRIAVSVSGK